MKNFLFFLTIFLLTASLPSSAYSLSAFPPKKGVDALDRASMECVSCHKLDPEAGGGGYHSKFADHPAGVDYPESKAFTSRSDLDPRLKLVDGRISCITCHIPYLEENHEALSRERARIPSIPDPLLVMDNEGSALCLLCHKK